MFEGCLVSRCYKIATVAGFFRVTRWLEALKNLVGERGFEPLTPCL